MKHFVLLPFTFMVAYMLGLGTSPATAFNTFICQINEGDDDCVGPIWDAISHRSCKKRSYGVLEYSESSIENCLESWSVQTPGTSNALYSVGGGDVGNIWAVGQAGTIRKWNGSTWLAQSSGTMSSLFGVRGSDADNVWAVGQNGVILKWDGSNWMPQTSGTVQSLRSVWVSDAGNVWAVGDGGAIRKWNGNSWSSQTSGTMSTLYSIWGSDVNNIWAVGQNGTIRKWNGSEWSAQTSGTTQNIYEVWGSDANNVWVVGDGGTIRKWNGSVWSAQTSGTTNALYSIWVSDANNAWVVGDGGTIRKWNGSNWSAQSSGTSLTLHTIWGSGAGNIWAVGDGGTMLYSDDQLIVPLPVELVSFDGRVNNSDVKLIWRTASETQNACFLVQHSTDAAVFLDLVRIPGAGNSQVDNNYQYTHEKPSYGTNYYRLKQVDFDGRFEYSHIVSLKMHAEEGIQVYPNPFSGEFQIDINSEQDELPARIYDAAGRSVWHGILHNRRQVLELPGIQSGMFWMEVDFDNRTERVKVLKN